MSIRLIIAAICALLLLASGSVLAQAPVAAGPATAEQVDAAIEKGLKFLWSKQQPNGLFSSGFWKYPTQPFNMPGGDEVICMAALAYAGEPLTKPEMMKSLKAMLSIEAKDTYVLGFRLITLAELYRRTSDEKMRTSLRAAMKQDAAKLVSFQRPSGAWDYGMTPYWPCDLSNTQIAMLGLQQAISCGVELRPDTFVKIAELYLAQQKADGGWSYGHTGFNSRDESYGTMTAAAVASLFLLRDILSPGNGCPCQGDTSPGKRSPKIEEAIQRGLKWLNANFDADKNPGDSGPAPILFWLYATERVGMITGLKNFGPHNWYAEGARQVLSLQLPDGSWFDSYSPTSGTAIALMFLIKGRGPVLMNKLKFDGEWDRHLHDAANLAEFVGNLKEQRFNWQVINLDVPVDEMHDAPLLYVSAESALKLSDEHKKKLRDFTDSGGTILFEASCGNRAADLAWRKSCQEIWPEWELKTLDKDHPLWAADAKIVANRPLLLGAGDGLRTFLFYAPRDISCAWNTMAVVKDISLFALGGNLYAYTTDRGKLRAKLTARETGPGKKYAGQTLSRGSKAALTVARVKHGGDWFMGRNYHPWQILAGQFQAQSGMPAPGLQADSGLAITEAEPVAPGAAIPAGTTILYLSGRTGCDLGTSGGPWLKDFATSGGFIFAEAVLGDKRFDEPARAALSAAGFTLKPLPTDSPLLTGQLMNGAKGYNVAKVGYSFALRTERVGQPTPLLVGLYLGDKLVGVYSPFDIMFSQTGCAAFGNRGYAADDARALAANIVLLTTQGAAPVAPPKPVE